ncbi:MAG: outer membrane lipoprotein carrier protein LolA [Myxococcota bacterium]|nr:outer membrane lipoprotein carrier protein LolA [Myxococcota bacterium]
MRGRSRPRRRTAGAAALLGSALWLQGPSATASEAGSEIEALLSGMAGTRGVVARFHEVKELGLLSEPVESRGVLYFVPPDRMVRITESPLRTALVVDADQIAFHDGGTAPVDLSGEPTARQFVENFTVLFRADVGALRERYEIRYEPVARDASWEMRLVPRSALLKRVITEVRLRGDTRAIREIRIEESDGDSTLTHVMPVDVDRALTEAELAALLEAPLDLATLPGMQDEPEPQPAP